MMTEERPATVDEVATLLHAYLDTPDLPAEVEMCCLRAATELKRAGAHVAPLGVDANHVSLADVATALRQLPAAVFETDPVLNAVALVTTAVGALESR
ncbi:MAG: hypothetical protein ACJ74U_15235 [Jatrophihabitantaceae bacterium]